MEVPKADGTGTKKPTVREARLAGDWVPGVTSINGCKSNPGLTEYIVRQAIDTMMSSPTVPAYLSGAITEKEMYRLIRAEIDEHKNTAAMGGKRLHALSEHYVLHHEHDKSITPNEKDVVEAIEVAIMGATGPRKWKVEESFADMDRFYGGRLDRRTVEHDVVIDLKTQEWKTGKKATFYTEFPMQLVAYAEGIRVEGDPPLKDQRLISVVAHRCHPEVYWREWKADEVSKAWAKFNALLDYFLLDRELGPYNKGTKKK